MASLLPPCTCICRQQLGKKATTSSSKFVQQQWKRHLSSSRIVERAANRAREELRYNFNPNPFDPAPVDAAARATYPTVTANDLKKHSTPPKKIRMLARDFIDDSLYNPNYGYFPKQAVIFDPDAALALDEGQQDASVKSRKQGFDFASMKNTAEWDRAVAESYGRLEEADEKASGLGRQVWHTPTELFKPYYAQAVAHHLATEYKLSLYPYNDLNIYEIGAGNGSLMAGILDFLRLEEPEVYKRTRYHTIEISAQLAKLQYARAEKAGHSERVQVVQQSIFDWNKVVSDPCFFLAFEVLDNLSHDVVRYKTDDNAALQCMIEIDERGDFSEVYQPVQDPLIKRFLRIRRDIRKHSKYAHTSLHPFLASHPLVRKAYASLPLAPNLSPPDFLPTKSLLLLHTLKKKFPNHRLLMSDFDYLPDTIPGRMAPVVQTRYEGQSVACSTYLVSQGWFDIFFPTDFRYLRDMYDNVMAGDEKTALEDEEKGVKQDSGVGLGWGNRRGVRVLSHRQFLERYGEPENTQLKDGTNPMLDLYENAAFIF